MRLRQQAGRRLNGVTTYYANNAAGRAASRRAAARSAARSSGS